MAPISPQKVRGKCSGSLTDAPVFEDKILQKVRGQSHWSRVTSLGTDQASPPTQRLGTTSVFYQPPVRTFTHKIVPHSIPNQPYNKKTRCNIPPQDYRTFINTDESSGYSIP